MKKMLVNHRGTTLIELLAVLVILSIIAAIALYLLSLELWKTHVSKLKRQMQLS